MDLNKGTLGTVDTGEHLEAEHHAKIACYVRDVLSGDIYGVTNQHVTRHVRDDVSIKTLHDQNVPFGTPLGVIDKSSQDIGLVKINESIKGQVYNIVSDVNGVTKRAVLYNGSLEELFDRRVFKCAPCSSICHIKSPPFDTSVFGMVCSKNEHQELFGGSQNTYQFCVKGERGKFSTKGESGSGIALDVYSSNLHKDVVELVGIVTGGRGECTHCLFLPKAIEELENIYKMNLKLCVVTNVFESQPSALCPYDKSTQIKFQGLVSGGISFFFLLKTPESINPLAFNLVDRALLFTYLGLEEFSVERHAELLHKEKELVLSVNQRNSMETFPLFENDNPGYKVVEEGLRACDALYNFSLDHAETHLKVAISCIEKSEGLATRFFSKQMTYITWFCLLKNTKQSLDGMLNLLNEGLVFYKENRHVTGFPQEIGPYLLYDFARFYLKQYDSMRTLPSCKRSVKKETEYRKKAVKKAKSAVRIMVKLYNEIGTSANLVRLVLFKSEYAYALLGGGHDFNVITGEVSEEDILEAETVIMSIAHDITEAPTVQYESYLVALCDLHYRQNSVAKALSVAEQCINIATEKKDKLTIYRAQRRIHILRQHPLTTNNRIPHS